MSDYIPKDFKAIESTLKPCPFCGEKPTIKFYFAPDGDGDETNVYSIGCHKCGIVFYQNWDYDWLVHKWDTREVTE